MQSPDHHHLDCLLLFPRTDPAHIDPACNCPPRIVRAVPPDRMRAGGFKTLFQHIDPLTRQFKTETVTWDAEGRSYRIVVQGLNGLGQLE